MYILVSSSLFCQFLQNKFSLWDYFLPYQCETKSTQFFFIHTFVFFNAFYIFSRSSSLIPQAKMRFMNFKTILSKTLNNYLPNENLRKICS